MGQRFSNLNGSQPQGLFALLKWLLTRKREPWPVSAPNPVFEPPPKPAANQAVVTFINHSTFLIRTPEATILTDPIFSERASPASFAGPKRARQPGIALDALPKVDIVLVSHDHYDHMDFASLRRLEARCQPRFVTTLGNAQRLRQAGLKLIEELNWWETVQLGNQLSVTCTPATHFSGRSLFDRDSTLWGGFLISSTSKRILFVGDSAYDSHFRDIRSRLGPIDVALIPIGAYRPRWFMKVVHMDPGEAVQVHLDLESKYSIGMHFGTFPLADEGIDEPVLELADRLKIRGIQAERFQVLGFGESKIIEG
jgi:L-ascorbate metabolism protein UlaG (beta-lactamase superfamily)